MSKKGGRSRKVRKGGASPGSAGTLTWQPVRGDLAVVALLLIETLLAYASSFHVPFHYDDFTTIVEDRSVRLQLSLRDMFVLNPFRPVLVLSFMLNYRWSGLDPFSYHVVNVAIHFANAALFYLLLRKMAVRAEPAGGGASRLVYPALAATLVAVHPLWTEAVTYLSSRSTLLAVTFILGSIHFFYDYGVRGGTRRWAASMACLVLGAATKEIGGLAPLFLLALVGLYFHRSRRAWLGLVPGVLLFLIGGAYRLHVFFRVEYQSLPRSIPVNLLTQLAAFPAYMKLYFVPKGLTIVHDFPVVRGVLAPPVLVGMALLIAIAALAIVWRRTRPLASFLLLVLLAAHVPGSVFPLQETMSEHRFYLQGIALGGLVTMTALSNRRGIRAMTVAVFAVISVLLIFVTYERNRVWQSEEALWADAVAKRPSSPTALSNYGDVLRQKGEWARAAPCYARALGAAPGNLDYTVNLGICLAGSGNVEEAEAVFEAAHKLAPRSTKPLVNLGNLCALRGDHSCARARYEEAVAVDPRAFEPRINLGLLYLKTSGNRDEALGLIEAAMRDDPVKALDFRETYERIKSGR